MSEEQLKQLFIEVCLTPAERVFISEPMNTRLEGKFEAFKAGVALGETV